MRARDGGVETVGGDGKTKKGKSRRPVSVPASPRITGIKRKTTTTAAAATTTTTCNQQALNETNGQKICVG